MIQGNAPVLARAYRSDIDGLRAIAILSVVCCHAGVRWLSGGFTGVDIFFVISGYLIGGHIYGEINQGKFSYLEFYRRRAKRILPPLYVVLGVMLVAGSLLLAPLEFRQLGEYAAATTASALNILLTRGVDYFNRRSALNPLLMTWSLGVEEQFYLVIPLAMVLLARLRRTLMLPMVAVVIIFSFTSSWILLAEHPQDAFYTLHARAWELGVGVGLAILESNAGRLQLHRLNASTNAVALLGLAFLTIPFFVYTPFTQFPGPTALPSVLGTALVIATANSWLNTRILSTRPIVFIGRISYSYYLWHWPLLAFLRIINGGILPLSWGLCGAVVALGLSILTYYFVEQPARASKLAPIPLLLRYAAVSACFILVSLCIYATRGLDRRFPVLASVDAETLEENSDPCIVQNGRAKPNLSPACVGTGPGQKIALWGDSHAFAMAPAVRRAGREHGYGFVEMAKTNCEPLIGASLYQPARPGFHQECVTFNAAVMNRLLADRTVKTVFLAGFWTTTFGAPDPRSQLIRTGESILSSGGEQRSLLTLTSALRTTLERLRLGGKDVVLFGDFPAFSVDPVWRFRTGRIALRRHILYTLRGSSSPVDQGTDRPADNSALYRQVRETVRQAAASVPGVTYFDLRKPLCISEDECVYRDGDQLYFRDIDHVSPKGSVKALTGWSFPTGN
jgi:peptidoglycan/LPS O-acetylase OafA/YrhL